MNNQGPSIVIMFTSVRYDVIQSDVDVMTINFRKVEEE